MNTENNTEVDSVREVTLNEDGRAAAITGAAVNGNGVFSYAAAIRSNRGGGTVSVSGDSYVTAFYGGLSNVQTNGYALCKRSRSHLPERISNETIKEKRGGL